MISNCIYILIYSWRYYTGRIIHICFHNIIVIYILIKKSVYNMLFFAYNYGNHIAQSFEG